MPKKLSDKDWIKSFELAPRVACNLVVVDSKKRFLLTKRTIPPYINMWHIPGSFIRKGESIEVCLIRIGKEEINMSVDIKKIKLLDVIENLNKDPRGHIIDLFYGYNADKINLKPNKESKELKLFESLPKDIGFNHRESLTKIGFK